MMSLSKCKQHKIHTSGQRFGCILLISWFFFHFHDYWHYQIVTQGVIYSWTLLSKHLPQDKIVKIKKNKYIINTHIIKKKVSSFSKATDQSRKHHFNHNFERVNEHCVKTHILIRIFRHFLQGCALIWNLSQWLCSVWLCVTQRLYTTGLLS